MACLNTLRTQCCLVGLKVKRLPAMYHKGPARYEFRRDNGRLIATVSTAPMADAFMQGYIMAQHEARFDRAQLVTCVPKRPPDPDIDLH